MSSNYGLFSPSVGYEGLSTNHIQNVNNSSSLIIGSNIISNNPVANTPTVNLRIQIPTLSPSPLPKPQPLKSPYSPIRSSRKNSLCEKYLNSPYKCSSPGAHLSSPRRNLERRSSRTSMDLSSQSPRHLRRRSQSLFQYSPSQDESLGNSQNTSRQRSYSIDLSSLKDTQKGFVFKRPYFLYIQYKEEKQPLVFTGRTLEELKNAINSCFSFLPVVRVCIEHPSIPEQLVNITSLDQLYDSAVIHLLPLENQ